VTTRYRRRPDLRLTALEGEGVVLHLGSRRYFSVTETGLTILRELEASRSFDDLVATLLQEYDVTRELAHASVAEFLEQCEAAQLLIVER
jgi:hypothetical protein